MNDFSLWSMLKQGWPVLSILLVMSIFSMATFVDRIRAVRRTRCNARQFVRYVIRVIEERGLEPAISYCAKHQVPVANAVLAVLEQNGDRDARQNAMENAIEQDVHQLEAGVAAIGTIASLAPFVGLFGTVLGIIKAFGSIAVSDGGGAAVVSAGIAEALVTTACGLLVAIPSVAAYNYCVHKIKNLAKETDLAVYELVAWLSANKQPPMWTGIRSNSPEPDLR
ncbi:MAG: MotA/TolQ/ExbB proton channel family protein [Kiritimatiellia bacterium]